ncbi:hypothetical protein TNCV_3105211 [Trichonephila clavipes]|nr:hypothetical protein TNCV_3105211 [Trichonephila clavipes]
MVGLCPYRGSQVMSGSPVMRELTVSTKDIEPWLMWLPSRGTWRKAMPLPDFAKLPDMFLGVYLHWLGLAWLLMRLTQPGAGGRQDGWPPPVPMQ